MSADNIIFNKNKKEESNTKKENMQAMKEMIIENVHIDEKDIFLKIDCGGYEWSSFKDMLQDILGKFSQIVIEYHMKN